MLDAVSWIMARTPWWLGSLWAWWVAWFWWLVLPVRRDVAASNLAQVFPEMDAATRGRTLRRSVHDLALGYVELLGCLRRPERFEPTCGSDGLHRLTDRQEQGLPCLVLQGHFGSFDLIMLAMGRGRGMELSCVVNAPTDAWAATLVEHARVARGVELIPPRHSMDKVYDAVERGRVVIFPADQRVNHGLELDFLGRPALTGTGLAATARKTRVPVFFVWQQREGTGRHVMHVSPEIELEWTDDRDADIARATAVFNEVLGDRVRRRPHGWLWLHKRWRR